MRVVILGGGTAGWMAAAGLERDLGRLLHIRLVESPEIGIVGVGEATLPHLRAFVDHLGIAEADFVAATHATYKLGIAFDGFGRRTSRYFHPFGTFGRDLAGVPFHHFWLRAGGGAPIDNWCFAATAARAGRFAPPEEADPAFANSYGYAYQFDATLFGPFLRTHAVARGVERVEAKVVGVERDGESGNVTALVLDSGERIEGDLFVDCSGFRSLLLGETLGEGWEDWGHWLPCDRAAALPCASPDAEIGPYTRAIAMPAGWRWSIPLQHRIGNGYVFSSAHVSEDEACAAIVAAVPGKPTAGPRVLRFKAGRRRRSWVRNVVAVGLASGFLEPLESTSIYLVQAAIMRLIELFPTDGITDADRDEFNRLVDMEYDRIRDFLILHYHATNRDDSPFWNDMRTMQVPESLTERMTLWRRTGRVARYGEGLFLEPSWVAVYLGQGVVPEAYDARADIPDWSAIHRAMADLRSKTEAAACRLPGHRAFLRIQADRATAA